MTTKAHIRRAANGFILQEDGRTLVFENAANLAAHICTHFHDVTEGESIEMTFSKETASAAPPAGEDGDYSPF